MRSTVVVSVSLLAVLVAVAQSQPSKDEIDHAFQKFVREYGKVYPKEEQAARYRAFADNYRFILNENAKGHSYKLGLNAFADMTPEEFQVTHLGLRAPKHLFKGLPYLGRHQVSNKTLPSSVDWTQHGAVTPVKNQQQCGSCWAFSATGAMEGAWQIATGQLVSLSEQQLVDCSSSFGNQGCNGGEMDAAFRYAEANAMCTEGSYSYQAATGICHASGCTVGIPQGGVVGFKDVAIDSEQDLMDAVVQQPVSVAIEADKSAFQLYQSGILSAYCGTNLDHGVLVVGYGAEGGTDYWLVKNSWGASWGMNGYVKLLRGKSGAGECGIKSQPSYPVVKGSFGSSTTTSGKTTTSTLVTTTPPAASPHYEKPPCRQDEVEAEVGNLDGEVCAPPCDEMQCPTDVPQGTRAKPQCILEDQSTGNRYCALSCLLSSGCPTGARCARSGGFLGICVYPKSTDRELPALTVHRKVQEMSGVFNV